MNIIECSDNLREGEEFGDAGTVTIFRRSPFTGNYHKAIVKATLLQFQAWNQGQLLQHAFPQLTLEEREFINSGVTPQEWNEAFKLIK